MDREIKIPDVGDIDNVEVIEICVARGDRVKCNDVLVVLESDKASMEVTTDYEGEVKDIKVALGDKVQTDSPVVTLGLSEQAAASEPVEQPESKSASSSSPPPPSSSPPSSPPPSPPPPKADDTDAPVRSSAQEAVEQAKAEPVRPAARKEVYAGPGVRKLARELGIDLTQVAPTGRHGRILKEDVQSHVRSRLSSSLSASGVASNLPAIDFSRFGEVDIQPLERIVLKTAARLQQGWQTVPQVTQHEEVDITELEAFRKGLRANPANTHKPKLTPLPFILKACASALAVHKKLNCSLSHDGQSYVFKKYVHIGVAVDTPSGLVVPVIRNVEEKGIWELGEEIRVLSEKAIKGQLKPQELQGGSFTVSSLGNLGGTGFTPIVNPPEVGILGVARVQSRPVYRQHELAERQMLPLSLSYDHRVVNGADAGRFMVDLADRLRDIRILLLD